MAPQVNRQDEDDRVPITPGSATVGVVELVVDPSRARNLVMDGAREAVGDRAPRFPGEDGRRADRWRYAGGVGDVVIELLGAGEADAIRELLP